MSDLSTLVPVPQYQEQRQHLFPSKSSLDWQIRQHRDDLVRGGALLMINGRWFTNPARFDACVLEIGTKAAQRHTDIGDQSATGKAKAQAMCHAANSAIAAEVVA